MSAESEVAPAVPSVLGSLFERAFEEVSSDSSLQTMVRERIFAPVLQTLREEMQPYVFVLAGVVGLMLLLLVLVTVMLLGQVLYG